MKWPKLDAGEMRHQITILGPTASRDASGANVVMAPVLPAMWAKIDYVRGTDVILSGQITTQSYLTVAIWWVAGIRANMQVQAHNGLYLIQSIDNVQNMDTVLILNCIAIGSNDN